MASPFTRSVRSACGLAVLASFIACGGSSDPDLFSASSSAGAAATSSHAGAPANNGGSAFGGSSARGGATSSGGSSSAGAGSTEAGAANGGSPAAGAGTAGSGGAALAGASNAGSANGGSAGAAGGAANGGSAGSSASAGNGSSGGNDGETCQTLFAKANKQLAAAQVCNFAADSMQCTATVKNLCKCEVPVNREGSAETKAYQDTLAQLDEKKCVQACSALACLPAAHAVCKVSAPGGATGTCVANYATPF